MSIYEQAPSSGPVSQGQLEVAVETLSNLLYLLEHGARTSREEKLYFELADMSMITLKRAAREARERLKSTD